VLDAGAAQARSKRSRFDAFCLTPWADMLQAGTPGIGEVEIPLPNDGGRLEILKIHAGPISNCGEFDWDAVRCGE